MPILAYPPVRWNLFKTRAADRRIALPPRTPEGSVLTLEVPDITDERYRDDFLSAIKVMIQHPDHAFVLYSDDPDRTHHLVLDIAAEVDADEPRNVLYGVEVSTQDEVNVRVPLLDAVPGPCVVYVNAPSTSINLHLSENPHVGWVVVEGSSGETSRPCHPLWIKALRTQCLLGGVAFRFEGWGDWVENLLTTRDGEVHALHVPKEVSDTHTAIHVSGLEAFNPSNTFDPFDPRNVGPSGTYGVDAGWTLMKRVGFRESGRDIEGREWDEAPLVGELTDAALP